MFLCDTMQTGMCFLMQKLQLVVQLKDHVNGSVCLSVTVSNFSCTLLPAKVDLISVSKSKQ